MGHLDAAALLTSEELPLRAVQVCTPELGAESFVFVAELSADERDELEELWAEKKKEYEDETQIGFRAWVVAYCLCDDQRKRLFDEDKIADAAAALGRKAAKPMARIFNTACRINGLLKSDVDTLEKNSVAKTGPQGDGSGESPSASASQVAERGSAKSRRKSTPSS